MILLVFAAGFVLGFIVAASVVGRAPRRVKRDPWPTDWHRQQWREHGERIMESASARHVLETRQKILRARTQSSGAEGTSP